MARFLTTIPSNLGFFNLGTVESYPTGGGGPTAYGPTSYFGSDPRPAEQGDNLNNPINLGDFSSIFKSQIITNNHGGLSRKQSTFYEIDENGHRQELPINDDGYVFHDSAIDYAEDDIGVLLDDYPSTSLKKGKYLFVITNDIRYIETTYSIGLNVSVLDWRFVRESPTEQINFGLITTAVTDTVNFGNL